MSKPNTNTQINPSTPAITTPLTAREIWGWFNVGVCDASLDDNELKPEAQAFYLAGVQFAEENNNFIIKSQPNKFDVFASHGFWSKDTYSQSYVSHPVWDNVINLFQNAMIEV